MCPTSSPSISAAPSPTSSPAMSRPARSPTPRARRPMVGWARRSSTASARLRSMRAQASFVKHGTTLVINALLQRVGAKTALLATEGLPRRAGDRPRQPHPAVQPALPSRAAAGSARTALRDRPSGSTGPVRCGRRSPSANSATLAETLQRSRRRGAGHQLPQLVPDARPRAGRGGGAAPAVAGCLRHHRHRADPRMARVRAHRDGGGERLCRTAGQPVHRRVRRRVAAAAASPARCC